MDAVLYVHGKGGSPSESGHYVPLFPECDVVGMEYAGSTPWEAGREIRAKTEELKNRYGRVLLVANSVGACFSLYAGVGDTVRHAFFISPVVDMERMILDLMASAGVTEEELTAKGVVPTAFGEDLSIEYLRYVRNHPVVWNVPTGILYGEKDRLVPEETVRAFSQRHGARLTVMKDGEHWFHTKEQMEFLDKWISEEKLRMEFFEGLE